MPHLLLGSSGLPTNEPLLIADVKADLLESIAESDEHHRALHAIDPRSLIGVPLIAQGRLVGSLILVRTTPARRYVPRDLFMAQELGRRAALAIENARLYRLAQSAIRARDDVLGIVAHDLRNPLGGIALQAELLLHKVDEGDPHARRSRRGHRTRGRCA